MLASSPRSAWKRDVHIHEHDKQKNYYKHRAQHPALPSGDLPCGEQQSAVRIQVSASAGAQVGPVVSSGRMYGKGDRTYGKGDRMNGKGDMMYGKGDRMYGEKQNDRVVPAQCMEEHGGAWQYPSVTAEPMAQSASAAPSFAPAPKSCESFAADQVSGLALPDSVPTHRISFG
jgi:hypothetical protein